MLPSANPLRALSFLLGATLASSTHDKPPALSGAVDLV